MLDYRTALFAGFGKGLIFILFGGLKNSGLGREGGNLSREFYTETRFTSFPLTPRK